MSAEVLRVVADPDLLPATVRRRSVSVDLFDTQGDLASSFGGIALPEQLRGAVRKRHIEHLAGRWCAREALRALRHPRAEDAISNGDDRAPVWPDGVVGSITHTQGFASAAVADARELRGVGVDSEERFSLDRTRRLRAHFARPGELEALTRDTTYDEALLATAVFSAKESVYKCVFPLVRRFFGFQVAEVVALSPEGALVVRILEGLGAGLRAGTLLEGRFVVTEAHVHTAIAIAR